MNQQKQIFFIRDLGNDKKYCFVTYFRTAPISPETVNEYIDVLKKFYTLRT